VSPVRYEQGFYIPEDGVIYKQNCQFIRLESNSQLHQGRKGTVSCLCTELNAAILLLADNRKRGGLFVINIASICIHLPRWKSQRLDKTHSCTKLLHY
jgi:hypothetical protein